MNLFDVISEDIFKPLALSDQRRYVDILLMLWKICRRRPMYAINKTEMIDTVEEYLKGFGDAISLSDYPDEDLPETDDKRSVATFMLRRLRSSGWLIEREGEYEEDSMLAINHHTVPIIRAFSEIMDPKVVTYKGKLFEVYSLLSHINDIDSPYESCLKVAEETLNDLNLLLHQLDASIEEHINNLTSGKHPGEILDLFDKYEDQIVVGAYQRFKTNDNLFYYRNTLYEKLDYCEEAMIDTLIKEYAEAERTSEVEAHLAISRIIGSMRSALEEMQDMIRTIDDHHIMYRTRAIQRAQFLIMSDGSTKSKIAGLLRYYASTINNKDDLNATDDTILQNMYQIFGQGYLDYSSLKAPSKRRKPTPIENIDEPEPLDVEYLETQNKALVEYVRTALTSENVNKYAQEILENTHAISAEAVLANDPSAIVKVIGLFTYSMSQDRVYNINIRDNYVTIGGIRFKDFIIERK